MRRSRTEISYSVLKRIQKSPVIKNHILIILRLNHNILKFTLEGLLNACLIECKPPFYSKGRIGVKTINKPYFVLTPEGRSWIADYENLMNR